MDKKFSEYSKNERAALVAWWTCCQNMRQADIWNLVKEKEKSIHRSQISRAVEDAERLGYLLNRTQYTMTLSGTDLAWVKSQLDGYQNLEAELRNRFTNFNSLIVANAALEDPGVDDDAWDRSVSIFGESTAPQIVNLFASSANSKSPSTTPKTVAIGWGRTLASLVSAIATLDPGLGDSSSPKKHIEVFPTWGTLFRPSVNPHFDGSPAIINATSSSALADALHRSLCGCPKPTLSINGLPAIVPKAWATGGSEKALNERKRRFLTDMSAFTSYKEIFGASEPLIDEMDCLLATIGAAKHSTRFYQGDSFSHYFDTSSTEAKSFRKHCVGDLGGVLLPVGGAGQKKAEKFIEQISKFYVCTQQEHLKDLADKSGKKGNDLGVVAVVHGSSRIDAVLMALNLGLINVLVICQHLARSLQKELSLVSS